MKAQFRLRKNKSTHFFVFFFLVLLGLIVTFTVFRDIINLDESGQGKKQSASIPEEAQFLLLARDNPNTYTEEIYKIDASTGKTIETINFTLNENTGSLGYSSFGCSYSVCKNAVWFSPAKDKAVIQTNHIRGPFEEPPFWYAWYLLDLNTGQLTELYREDIQLVSWAYDEKNESIFIETEVEEFKDGPLPRKYFQLDPTSRSLTEVDVNKFPKNLFVDYYSLFDLNDKKKLVYMIGEKQIGTDVSLQDISEVAGVAWE